MSLRNALENLKARPKDEQNTVAGSAAIIVVVLLLIGWAVYFSRTIRDTDLGLRTPAGLGETLNLEAINNAREQLLGNYNNAVGEKTETGAAD